MTRLKELLAQHTVLQVQLVKLNKKIMTLKQIAGIESGTISSVDIGFTDDGVSTLRIEKGLEKLKTAILEILEEEIKDE